MRVAALFVSLWTLLRDFGLHFGWMARGDFFHTLTILSQANNASRESMSEILSVLKHFQELGLPITKFIQDLAACASGRRWFMTASGLMGFAPPRSKQSELIRPVYGTQTP
jgi:hypothetical protein